MRMERSHRFGVKLRLHFKSKLLIFCSWLEKIAKTSRKNKIDKRQTHISILSQGDRPMSSPGVRNLDGLKLRRRKGVKPVVKMHSSRVKEVRIDWICSHIAGNISLLDELPTSKRSPSELQQPLFTQSERLLDSGSLNTKELSAHDTYGNHQNSIVLKTTLRVSESSSVDNWLLIMLLRNLGIFCPTSSWVGFGNSVIDTSHRISTHSTWINSKFLCNFLSCSWNRSPDESSVFRVKSSFSPHHFDCIRTIDIGPPVLDLIEWLLLACMKWWFLVYIFPFERRNKTICSIQYPIVCCFLKHMHGIMELLKWWHHRVGIEKWILIQYSLFPVRWRAGVSAHPT